MFIHQPHCNREIIENQARIMETPHYLYQHCQENAVVINLNMLQRTITTSNMIQEDKKPLLPQAAFSSV